MKTTGTTTKDKATLSALSEFWTIRPPKDVRELVAKAIRIEGRDKAFWICEAIRFGLRHHAGKKTESPRLLKCDGCQPKP